MRKQNETLSVRVPRYIKRAIRREAREADRSVGAIVNKVLAAHVDRIVLVKAGSE